MLGAALKWVARETLGNALREVGTALGNTIARKLDPTHNMPPVVELELTEDEPEAK